MCCCAARALTNGGENGWKDKLREKRNTRLGLELDEEAEEKENDIQNNAVLLVVVFFLVLLLLKRRKIETFYYP